LGRAKKVGQLPAGTGDLEFLVLLWIVSDLLRQAKERKIYLSKTLEESLEKILKDQDQQVWLEENRAAIEAANRFVDQHGLWSDGLRQF